MDRCCFCGLSSTGATRNTGVAVRRALGSPDADYLLAPIHSLTAGLERINQITGPVPVHVFREVDRFLFPQRLQDVTQGINGERLSHADQRPLHFVNGVRETGERLGRRLLVALGRTFEEEPDHQQSMLDGAKRFFDAGIWLNHAGHRYPISRPLNTLYSSSCEPVRRNIVPISLGSCRRGPQAPKHLWASADTQKDETHI